MNQIDIKIIPNLNNRLNSLRAMFQDMVSQGFGKFEKDLFCISTNVQIQPRNQDEQIFLGMQNNSKLQGIHTNCYCLKPEDDTKKEETVQGV